ncbi:MAG: hypothetical protein EU549_02160, partial [Promethearchaeota archaeon]
MMNRHYNKNKSKLRNKIRKNSSMIRLIIIISIIVCFSLSILLSKPGLKGSNYNEMELVNNRGLSENTVDAVYTVENETNAIFSLNKTKIDGMTANNYLQIDTEDWNFTGTMLYFEDIHYNEIITVENNSIGNTKQILNKQGYVQRWAQEFELPSNHCKLINLSLYLYHEGPFNLWVEIYNSTAGSGDADPIPDTLIYITEETAVEGSPAQYDWVLFNFPELAILNTSHTVGDSFYFILNGMFLGGPKGSIEWEYADDSNGDYGNALQWTDPLWSWDSIDFLANIGVMEIFNPEEINMQVNETIVDYKDVKTTGINSGEVSITNFITNSNVSIHINATLPVNFQIIANYHLANQTQVPVYLYTDGDSQIVDINISITINSLKDAINPQLNVSLFSSWNVSYIERGGIRIGVQNWERFGNNLLINTSNGNYLIKCLDNNYLEAMYLLVGGIEPADYFVNQNLTVNVSTRFESSQVPINLIILNSTGFTVFEDQSQSIENKASLGPFNMIDNDEYLIYTSWSNGSSLGFDINQIEVKYRAKLDEIGDNINESSFFEPGDIVYVDVLYNNTDLNEGIEGAIDYIEINMTSSTQYNVSEFGQGIYNITLFTDRLTAKNHTFKITADMPGYEASSIIINFEIGAAYNASLNLTKYYGNQYIDGNWWIKPNPYFDDDTHKIQIIYRNGTEPNEGIYPAAIYAYPNWTDDVWYGNPYDLDGKYDINIITEGLHEGDYGEILVVATSSWFETKEIKVYLKIDEIPKSLLSFDVTGFEEITAYEGEIVQIAASFIDNFHGNTITFSNNEEGNITWAIKGTNASQPQLMSKLITTYIGYIDLPYWEIEGGTTYNITITGRASLDYAMKEQNITLHVLPKEKTILDIYNSTNEEVRIGRPLHIYSWLKFDNGTDLADRILHFNLSYYNGSILKGFTQTTLLTNGTGIATYYISEIPNNIDTIIVNCSYDGTEKIAPVISSLNIPVLDKYKLNLNIFNYSDGDIRVGKSLYIYCNLTFENSSASSDKLLDFNLYYYNETNILISTFSAITTNGTGIATYYISEIPEDTSNILIEVFYAGTKTITSIESSFEVLVLPKYSVNLIIDEEYEDGIRVGKSIKFIANLTSPELGLLKNRELLFNISYINTENSILVSKSELTDINGVASYEISEIPRDAKNISLSVIFSGTKSISSIIVTKLYTILGRYNVSLKLIPNLPQEILVGSYLSLGANLTNSETGEPIINATIRFKIIFNSGSDSISKLGITGSDGTVWIDILIPNEVSSSNYFYVSLEYDGTLSIQNNTIYSDVQVEIKTPIELFIDYLPYILLVIAIVVAATVIYQYGVRKPRIKRRKKHMNSIYRRYLDVMNLDHIMVIEKNTGASVFNYSFGARKFDPDLIAGFLTAIASFQKESKIKEDKKESIKGFELSYANFKILLNTGDYARVALILDDDPTDLTRRRVIEFIKLFESVYKQDLKTFRGNLKPFRAASKLVEEVFDANLLFPHRIDTTCEVDNEEISNLQSSIVTLAITLQKSQGYFTIPTLFENVVGIRRETDEEIIFAIYGLRNKKIFYSFHIDELERILEMEKLKEQSCEIGDQIEGNIGSILKNKGVSNKTIDSINNFLREASDSFKTLFIQKLEDLPDDKKPGYVSNKLIRWKTLLKDLKNNKDQADKLVQKNDYYGAIRLLSESRVIEEELGREENADIIANEILKLMENLNKNEPE